MIDGSTQPVAARQLAQLMRKRQLLRDGVDGPNHLLKPRLIAEESEHRSRGVRPHVVHRGRDLFSTSTPSESSLRRAEESAAEAIQLLERATRRVLAKRLSITHRLSTVASRHQGFC